MKIEDIAPGQRVRAVGHPVKSDDQLAMMTNDAPIMVVRDVTVHCLWFVNGTQHIAAFRLDELEVAS